MSPSLFQRKFGALICRGFKMYDSSERRKVIKSKAAQAGGLLGSEAGAERALRRQALHALDRVERSLKTGFLTIEEVESKLGLKVNLDSHKETTR
jgi:hypothetical protein